MRKRIFFEHNVIMIGFGSIGRALLPLLLRDLELQPSRITIMTATRDGEEIAAEYGIDFRVTPLASSNYQMLLTPLFKEGDLLLNMSVDVSSVDLIVFCQKHNVLYLDLTTEPWKGGYTDTKKSLSERTNYALREQALQLKNNPDSPTAVITHGANPGMVSHFVKQALLNMAQDNNLSSFPCNSRKDWAILAQSLGIKSIHIAERDAQVSHRPYNPQEFINTWSVEGFISEGLQPAELGWGTHEKHLPKYGKLHEYGCKAAIYLSQPGIKVRVRSWTPSCGAYHGFLIAHAEAISIADYLSLEENNKAIYRPTVHYAYLPCPLAVLSLHQLNSNEGIQQPLKHILLDDITEGYDELGVLLMGNSKGAYWYGSTVNIQEARKLAPYNSATTLQIVAGALAAVYWTIENPRQGVIEPEEIDYKYALEVAQPYLGKMGGHYTSWTPLDNRGILFEEEVDASDPWQFTNILVNKG